MARFDEKIWNGEVFEKYRSKVPNTKLNVFIKSGVFVRNQEIASKLPDQAGGNYITEPIKGLLDGDVVNYDGVSDITSTSRKTFKHSKVVHGRAKGWQEKDFSTEITGAKFLPVNSMAGEVGEYYEGVDQDDLLAILEGIFKMTDTAGKAFADKHTTDVSEKEDGHVKAGTLNRAITKAAGDRKAVYKMAIMNSAVAADLEDMQLLEYLPYTDSEGIQRDLMIGRWNGKEVLISDEGTVAEVGGDDTPTLYQTYVLGKGCFEYANLPVQVPNEMVRDAKKNGGITELITRQRKMFAPKWISFTKKAMATDSPTKEEFKNGANWEIVNDDNPTSKTYVDHRLIPIVKIISTATE